MLKPSPFHCARDRPRGAGGSGPGARGREQGQAQAAARSPRAVVILGPQGCDRRPRSQAPPCAPATAACARWYPPRAAPPSTLVLRFLQGHAVHLPRRHLSACPLQGGLVSGHKPQHARGCCPLPVGTGTYPGQHRARRPTVEEAGLLLGHTQSWRPCPAHLLHLSPDSPGEDAQGILRLLVTAPRSLSCWDCSSPLRQVSAGSLPPCPHPPEQTALTPPTGT